MIEQGELTDCFVCPFVRRGEEPGEGEDEPPQKGCYHGVIEETKDKDAGSVDPRPFAVSLNVGSSRAGDAAGADDECQEIAECVDVEREGEVHDRSPWILETRGV